MLQIDQVILCVWSSVNQQGLFADKNLEGTCSGVYFVTERLVKRAFQLPKSRSGCHRNNTVCVDQMICNLH